MIIELFVVPDPLGAIPFSHGSSILLGICRSLSSNFLIGVFLFNQETIRGVEYRVSYNSVVMPAPMVLGKVLGSVNGLTGVVNPLQPSKGLLVHVLH